MTDNLGPGQTQGQLWDAQLLHLVGEASCDHRAKCGDRLWLLLAGSLGGLVPITFLLPPQPFLLLLLCSPTVFRI